MQFCAIAIQDIDDDDVSSRALNANLIDLAVTAHHLADKPTRSKAMSTKRFVQAAAVTVLIAISGQAYAGTTISDTRYWPSEASSTGQNAVQRPENAFYSAERPQALAATATSYQGGPKGNDD
jgi:hypothetical protein